MKRLSLVLLMIGLASIIGLTSGPAAAATAQSGSDACHVYLIDVEAAEKAFENFDSGASDEAQAKALSAGVQILGEFVTVVGEEELTTRSYAFLRVGLMITAGVFYTDESIPGESMLLAIAVSDRALKDAFTAPDAALAEVAYDDNTSIVRVKKYIKVKGRSYLVGLQCNCKEKAGAK